MVSCPVLSALLPCALLPGTSTLYPGAIAIIIIGLFTVLLLWLPLTQAQPLCRSADGCQKSELAERLIGIDPRRG